MGVDIYVWLGILILAVVVEIISLGLTSIWFAGGALLALIIAAIHGPIWLQVLCFVAVSVALLVFTRPIAVKYFNRDRVRTNVESLVGKQAIVLAEVDNLQGTGQVSVGGQEWSAKSYDDDTVLPKDAIVDVVAISGVKLICRPETASVAEKQPEA